MRLRGRRYRDEWIPNFFPARPLADFRIRVSRAGKLIALTPEEDRQIDQVFMDEDLFRRLERTGHIVTAANAQTVFAAHRTWFSATYAGPALHIVSVTKRCNLACTYCHMLPEPVRADPTRFDLQPEMADRIVEFIMSSPNEVCHIEFQGGEPFLNFPAMVRCVETAKRLNAGLGKTLAFAVQSNLMVATDDQLRWCQDNGVGVGYTLNGPPDVHDRYRVTRSGKGSFQRVFERMQSLRGRFPGVIKTAPLCVIGSEDQPTVIRTIDFFNDLGFDAVALIKLRHLGLTKTSDLGFSFDKFMRAYLGALDYILEKNRYSERPFAERMVQVALNKIFGESDYGFVDWRNPTGDVSCVLTYDYDGEILPSDEARSMREEFSLGNVRDMTYEQLISSEATYRTINLSLRDREAVCRECPYNPYCGVHPILEFARSGDARPRPHESQECLFTMQLLDWTISKYLEDPIPLMRMLPDADGWLQGLLTEATGAGQAALPLRRH